MCTPWSDPLRKHIFLTSCLEIKPWSTELYHFIYRVSARVANSTYVIRYRSLLTVESMMPENFCERMLRIGVLTMLNNPYFPRKLQNGRQFDCPLPIFSCPRFPFNSHRASFVIPASIVENKQLLLCVRSEFGTLQFQRSN
jgi:hypothetical protein